MSMTMLVLIARAPSQPTKTLKSKEMILDNRRITIREVVMMLAYRSAQDKQFLRMF